MNFKWIHKESEKNNALMMDWQQSRGWWKCKEPLSYSQVKQIRVIFKTKFQVSGNCPKDKQELGSEFPTRGNLFQELVRKACLWYLNQDSPSPHPAQQQGQSIGNGLGHCCHQEHGLPILISQLPIRGLSSGEEGVSSTLILPPAACGPV